ncbi:PadR family transcriptional regulator [Lederbergia sp. NSJ-179]|uniref:PadR family transcriptional regulator n=1 Tax=Lederbergia sp. NSJ-179 TaxID=2931402 RepID=UPI001FD5F164|nr:PadR family transcriptional regulator [Lederbergia sp. NSJ-179]MCJ7843545.1 PadR family transcriptional regulator [Lederbergia sp. NSJ-179]
MSGKLSSDILRGHTDTIVLASLLDRDRYGFEIYNRVLQKTENLYELKETTLYSSYKRLEKDGFIESYWGDETQGGRRKYYHITERGRELYHQKLEDYEFTKKILERLFTEE